MLKPTPITTAMARSEVTGRQNHHTSGQEEVGPPPVLDAEEVVQPWHWGLQRLSK